MAGPWLPNGFNFHRGLNPRKPNFAALPDLPVLWTLAMAMIFRVTYEKKNISYLGGAHFQTRPVSKVVGIPQ